MAPKPRSITRAGSEREELNVDRALARRLEDALWVGGCIHSAAATPAQESERAGQSEGDELAKPLALPTLKSGEGGGAPPEQPRAMSLLAGMYGQALLSAPLRRAGGHVPARYKSIKKKRLTDVEFGAVPASRKIDGMVCAEDLNALRTLANPVVQFKLDTNHVDLLEAIEPSGDFPRLALDTLDEDVLHMGAQPGYVTPGGVPVLLNSPRSIVLLLRTGVSVQQLQRAPPPCADPTDAESATAASHNPVYRHNEKRREQLLSALRSYYRSICEVSPEESVRAYFAENRDPVEDTLPPSLRSPAHSPAPQPSPECPVDTDPRPSVRSVSTDRSSHKSFGTIAMSDAQTTETRDVTEDTVAAGDEAADSVSPAGTETASGGTDASLRMRGPRGVRSGIRAVGLEQVESPRRQSRARSRLASVTMSESLHSMAADVDLADMQRKISASKAKMEGMMQQDTEVRLTKMLQEQREQERKVELIKQHRARLEKVAVERGEEKQQKQFLNELRAEKLVQQKRAIQTERDREMAEKHAREVQMMKRKAEMEAAMKQRRRERAEDQALKLAERRQRLKHMEKLTIEANLAAIEEKGKVLDQVEQRKAAMQQRLKEEGAAKQADALARQEERERAMQHEEDERVLRLSSKFVQVNARLDTFKVNKQAAVEQKQCEEAIAKEVRDSQIHAERQRQAAYIERKKREKVVKEANYKQRMSQLAKEREERHLQKTLQNMDKESRRKQGASTDVYKSLLLQNRLEDQDKRILKRGIEIEVVRERTRKQREDVQIQKEERMRLLTDLEIKARQHIFFKTVSQAITL
eukprot:TRINITY_DN2094_c1_g10_i1.p1 TRINITY_DN2094_c1_g10~~TRINITY_DN2094_c1_g10_i1.p1  ORF type:complete len:845 (+),score=322.09 TRINITY_DN2094_c1_g10_i1:104-2536(+)